MNCKPSPADTRQEEAGNSIITLGKDTKDLFPGDEHLPSPKEARERGDSAQREIARKAKRIHRRIETKKKAKAATESHAEVRDVQIIDVAREKGDLQRVATAVILDCNLLDYKGKWWPPQVIEALSFEYMSNSQVVGDSHERTAAAKLVESWIEPYPSPEDRALAHENKPHRIYRRKFGRGFITSGCWVGSTQNSPEEWALIEAGERTGFSVGAEMHYGTIDASSRPEVEVIDHPGNGDGNE